MKGPKDLLEGTITMTWTRTRGGAAGAESPGFHLAEAAFMLQVDFIFP